MSDGHRLAWWAYVLILCGLPMFVVLSSFEASEPQGASPWLYYVFGLSVVLAFGYGGEVLNVFNNMNDTVIVVGVVALFLSLPFVYFLYLALDGVEFVLGAYTYSMSGFVLCLVPPYFAFLGFPLLYYSPF